MSTAALVGGWTADLLLGDPRRWHPVAGFGRCAHALERAIYAPTRRRGAAFAAALVGLAALFAELAGRAAEHAGLRRGAVLAAVIWTA
ncbi:MAG TPA: cobalamin biosynthesis protein, partial [Thermoleophilaceae bacterium]|nr:cobalamin biosynthesis protein [Thermoleophilaceae bacterium]